MKVKYSKGDIVYFIRDRYYEESEEDYYKNCIIETFVTQVFVGKKVVSYGLGHYYGRIRQSFVYSSKAQARLFLTLIRTYKYEENKQNERL